MEHATRHRRTQARSALGIMVIAGLALTGCSSNAETLPEAGEYSTDTIRTVFSADPTTFAPNLGRNVNDYDFSRLLFSTLIVKGDNNELIPSLATEWDVTATEGVFTIREDATCGDGSLITAEAVAASLQHFADPTGGTMATQVFGPGAPTITADNAANAVTITLAQPWTDLTQGLTLPGSSIVCGAGLADPEGLAAGTVEGAFSGPYLLTKKQAGVEYEFTLRDDYTWPDYGLKGVPATTITATVNSSSSAVANELLTDTKDVATIIGADMTRFDGNDAFATEVYPQGTTYVLFNRRDSSIFADEKLRIAAAKAINQKAFLQASTGGLGEAYASFAPAGIACASTDFDLVIGEDVDAATKVLSGVKVRMIGANIVGANGAGNTYVAEALRSAGAEVELVNSDVATWSTSLVKQPESWDLTIYAALNAAGTMNGSIISFNGIPVEEGGQNVAGVVDADVATLQSAAMGLTPGDERCDAYAEAQEIALERALVVPLGSQPAQASARDGFSISVPNGVSNISTLRITK